MTEDGSFWGYSRVSGSIADDSIENDLFCECSSEGWRSPIALTFEPITKIWRAHILQSKPFNISIEKYVRYLNFFRFDKIFSPKKTMDKKERKRNISPQWKWCPPYPGLAPEEVWKNHLWVRRWHCCDGNDFSTHHVSAVSKLVTELSGAASLRQWRIS